MKKKLAFAILASVISSQVSAKTQEEPLQEYQKIIELPGINKDRIYDKANQWIATKFRSANSVIQYQDKQSSTIISKGNIPFPCTGTWLCAGASDYVLNFTLKVEGKDNKARVTFGDLRQYRPAGLTSYNAIMPETSRMIYEPKFKTSVNTQLDSITQDIESYIKSGTNDNW